MTWKFAWLACCVANQRVRLPPARPGPIRGASMSALELYEDLIAARRLERDRAQEHLLARFGALEQRVTAHRSARRTQPLGWLFGGGNHDQPVKGVYVFGDVGRGKTMLMDLFFEAS